MLSKEKIKAFAKWIDDKVDWKKITGKEFIGGILEAADNWILPQTLTYLNSLSDKVPEKFHDNINNVVDACIADNAEIALNTIPDLYNDLANIKALDDELETAWITINLEAAIQFIEYYFRRM